MSASLLEVACRHVYRKFPALKDVKPTAGRSGPHLVFTFRASHAGPPGTPAIRQIVRVTVSDAGEIMKTVTSRG